jgi:hypothetical protein
LNVVPVADPAAELVVGHIEVLQFDGHARGSGHDPLLVTLVSHPVAGLHDDVLTFRKQFLAQPPEMVAEGLTQRVIEFDAELRHPLIGAERDGRQLHRQPSCKGRLPRAGRFAHHDKPRWAARTHS